MKTREQLDKHIDRQIKRAERDLRWANWYLNRGRVYGSGAVFRSTLRRASWRRIH